MEQPNATELSAQLTQARTQYENASIALGLIEARARDREAQIASLREEAEQLGADPDDLPSAIKEAEQEAAQALGEVRRLLDELAKDMGISLTERDPYDV